MTDQHLQPYLDVVSRVSAMAAAADPVALDAEVPACPGWSAADVVRHLAGLAEDWVDGHLEDYGSDRWAQAQVDRFRETDMVGVISAWDRAVGRFGDLGPSPLGGTPAMWAFGDAVVHEADLRPVLAPGTTVPPDGMALGLKAAIARWRAELGAAGTPPLDIVVPDLRTWRVGDPDAEAASVTTSGYELFRALFGRRSRSQVEAWDWSADSAPYLDVPLPYPFRWADNPVVD
ncbi:MAG: maleylpyruvate isomerase family mycothiol-dependent enzyme [Actinomycetota bacterium]